MTVLSYRFRSILELCCHCRCQSLHLFPVRGALVPREILLIPRGESDRVGAESRTAAWELKATEYLPGDFQQGTVV